MDAFSDVPVDAVCEAEFDRAFELLLKLVDLRRADEMMPLGPGAVYTASARCDGPEMLSSAGMLFGFTVCHSGPNFVGHRMLKGCRSIALTLPTRSVSFEVVLFELRSSVSEKPWASAQGWQR